MAEQWLSIVEYARNFAISDMTVRRRIRTGKLHAVLKDGKYFIPVRQDQKRTSTKPSPVTPAYPKTFGHLDGRFDDSAEAMSIVRGGSPVRNEAPSVGRPSVEASQLQRVTSQRHQSISDGEPSAIVPPSIRGPMASAEAIMVKGDALLGFCEGVLQKLQCYEDQLRQAQDAKVQTLEARLGQKDAELANLRQQVEDLQVLVKILEKRSA